MASRSQSQGLYIWLLCLIFLVLGMVVVGGLTRLTDSGLSMVDWRPLMGVLPPLSEAEWLESFANYKAYPEYRMLKPDMTLAEYKGIFYWEYGHRMLGRFLGFAFLLPFLYFWAKGYLKGGLTKKLLFAFFLGGAQGVLGWFMVQSGLVDKPYVSHFRLAAHLSLALFLGCYLLWLYWDVAGIRRRYPSRYRFASLPLLSVLLLALVCVQILYGAFTAGLNAGLIYNTFPSMNGHWLPPHFAPMVPFWRNFLMDEATIQLVHRVLGMATLLAVFGYAFAYKMSYPMASWPLPLVLLLASVLAQVALGIMTLVWRVPVVLASLHQFGACILLFCCLYQVYWHYGARAREASERAL